MPDRDPVLQIDKAIESFRGDITELERAIGAFLVGRRYGWKPLMLVHDKYTIKKYEKHLGVDFREALPEVGPLAMKLRGYRTAVKVGNIWKAIKGEIPNTRGSEVDKGPK